MTTMPHPTRPAFEPTDGSHADSSLADSGVDLVQIRAFLELTPLQRLRRMQSFVAAVNRIRGQNPAHDVSAELR
jgi:hypothetical protein